MRLTSLILVEERLLESEYFAKRLGPRRYSPRFGYELNAFLSAARSVTFLLQKEFAGVPGFGNWWQGVRDEMRADAASRFFLDLRNFSQKEGRISVAGFGRSGGRGLVWTYSFVGGSQPVPQVLAGRDASECCREHVAKLAAVVLRCADAFPFHACPRSALTIEGAAALELDLDALERRMGFPPGWGSCAPDGMAGRLRILREHVDGVDFASMRRLAQWRPPRRAPGTMILPVEPPERFRQALLQRLEAQWAAPTLGSMAAEAIVEATLAAHDKG